MPNHEVIAEIRASIKRSAASDAASTETLQEVLTSQFETNFPDIDVETFTANGEVVNPNSPLRLTGELSKLSYLVNAARKSLWEFGGRTPQSYPADPAVLRKYPELDPKGVYSVADAEIKSRIQNLFNRAPALTEDARKDLYQLFDRNDPKTQEFYKDLDTYGKQVRRLDRMIQICGDDPDFDTIKKNLLIQRQDMISGKNYPSEFDRYLKYLEGMEIVAGIKPPIEVAKDAPMDDPARDKKRDLESHLGRKVEPSLQKDVSVYEVNGYKPEHRLKAKAGLYEENWGKFDTTWDMFGMMDEDSSRGFKELQGYAQGLGKGPLGAAFPHDPTELNTNPLDVVMVEGRTARERMMGIMMEEAAERVKKQKGVRQPSQEDVNNAYLLLLADRNYCKQMAETAIGIGLMSDGFVTVIPVNQEGRAKYGNAIQVKNGPEGYHPDLEIPEERPVANWWQRFTHWAFGAYKEKFAQIARFDREQEFRERIDDQVKKINNNSKSDRVESMKMGTDWDDYSQKYQTNLDAVYGSPNLDVKDAGGVVRQIRSKAEGSQVPYQPTQHGISEKGYTALCMAAAFRPEYDDMVNGTGENRSPRWGCFWEHATEDIINSRPNTGETIKSEIVDDFHLQVRKTLGYSPEDKSPEAEKQRQWMRDAVSRMVRGTLNSPTPVSTKTNVILSNIVQLKDVMEDRPDILGDLPEDVKLGMRAAENILTMEERVRNARKMMAGDPKPTPAQAKELYLDIAMERYVNGLYQKNGDAVAKSDPGYVEADRKKTEAEARCDEINAKEAPTPEESKEFARLGKVIGVESAKATGFALNAFASTPLSPEITALATPGLFDLVRAGMYASPCYKAMVEDMENAPDYLHAGYDHSLDINNHKRNEATYAGLPTTLQLKAALDRGVKFTPVEQVQMQPQPAREAPDVPMAQEVPEQPQEQPARYFGFPEGEVPDFARPGYVRPQLNNQPRQEPLRGMVEKDPDDSFELEEQPKPEQKKPMQMTRKK